MGGAAVTEDDQRERIAEDATAHAARDTRCSKADIASCVTVLEKLPGPYAVAALDLLPVGNIFHGISEQRPLLVNAQFVEGNFTRVIVNLHDHKIGPHLLSRTKVQHGCRLLLLGLARTFAACLASTLGPSSAAM